MRRQVEVKSRIRELDDMQVTLMIAGVVVVELVEPVRRIVRGQQAEFFVFRYQMPQGHWAGSEWVLGLAGPFFADWKPFRSMPGGFSRADDVEGKVAPTELVDWYVGMLEQKFGADDR